jgi:hypothetical protein
MKKNKKFEHLISAYIDDTLTQQEKEFVEKELLTRPEWDRYHRELKLLKGKMHELPDLIPTEQIWPTLQEKLRRKEKQNKESLEIIPKKLIPVVTILAMMVVGLGSFTVMRNWDSISSYYQSKREVVEDIYEQGLVQGALRPLFASLTNDDMLQFALRGTLSIPDTEGQALRIESDSHEQYELDITEDTSNERVPSFADLSRELSLSELQIQKIDSVLAVYRERLAQSVFIHDEKEMMVSPELVGLDKFLLASVANELHPPQRAIFGAIAAEVNPQIHIPDVVISFPQGSSAHSYDVKPSPPPSVPQAPVDKAGTRRTEAGISRSFIILKPDTVLTADVVVPPSPAAPRIRETYEQAREMHDRTAWVVNESMKNTRIRISPFADERPDSISIQVYAYVRDRSPSPASTDNMIRIESHRIPRPDSEYFIQLRELSNELHKHADALRIARQPARYDSLHVRQFYGHLDETLRVHLGKIYEELGKFSWEEGKVYAFPESIFLNEDFVFPSDDPEFMYKLKQHMDSVLIHSRGFVPVPDTTRIQRRR